MEHKRYCYSFDDECRVFRLTYYVQICTFCWKFGCTSYDGRRPFIANYVVAADVLKPQIVIPRVNDYSTRLVKKRSDNCRTKGNRGETCPLKSRSLPTKPVMQYAKAKFRHKSCYCYNCDGEKSWQTYRHCGLY